MADVTPPGATAYVPTALVGVAAVLKTSTPDSDVIESPLTNPEPAAENTGSGAPNVFTVAAALTASGARSTSIDRFAVADV